jgi:hypothetical protein
MLRLYLLGPDEQDSAVGPMEPIDWQALKAWVITGPRYQFRLRQNHLLSRLRRPWAMTGASSMSSRYGISDAAGTTYKQPLYARYGPYPDPRGVVKADLTWRWKKEKGISYAEDFNTAERMIVNALGRSGGQRDLYLDNLTDARPGKRPLFMTLGR